MEPLKEIAKYILHKKNLGYLEEDVFFYIALIVLGISVITGIYKLTKWLHKNIIINRIFRYVQFYTKSEIKSALKHYIPTKAQNISPSTAQEPGFPNTFVVKEKLHSLLIQRTFKGGGEYKHVLILADSGMGKTTFMINLYVRWLRLKFWVNETGTFYKLIPLGDKDALKEISKVKDEDQNRTVLLLDAFDEDNAAVLNYKARLDEILEITKRFKIIIITCRTQFFSTADSIPQRTGLMKYGGEKGEFQFCQIYISPFDDRDIKKYLKKKYPFYRYKKRRVAYKIVAQCPNLMVRPMLLNYIEDIINQSKVLKYIDYFDTVPLINRLKIPYFIYEVSISFTFQIYEILIEKWIDREARRANDISLFKTEMYRFTEQLAVDIYDHRFSRQGLFADFKSIKSIAENNNIELDDIDMTSRSLLNRNVEGHFKFSHRSILEYFLASRALTDRVFNSRLKFEGMENVKLFLIEMGLAIHIKKFYQEIPNFTIDYCVSDGGMGRIHFQHLSVKFINNINFIKFDDQLLTHPEILKLILSFSSLKVLKKEEVDLGDFSGFYKNLIHNKQKLEAKITLSPYDSNIGRYRSDLGEMLADIREIEEKFAEFKRFEGKLKEFLEQHDLKT